VVHQRGFVCTAFLPILSTTGKRYQGECDIFTTGEYLRNEAEAVVIRPPQPPTPPRFTGEAVIGPLPEGDRGRKTLVLDLDETLVHSSFKPIPDPDYIIPVEIEGRVVDVYVLKRPWCAALASSLWDGHARLHLHVGCSCAICTILKP